MKTPQSALIDPQEPNMAQVSVVNERHGIQPTADPENKLRVIARPDGDYVIVPGSAVTLLNAPIPTASVSQAMAAAPYAIEDSLAVDPTDVHVAVGALINPGQWQVAVVNPELMRAWLENVSESAIVPAALVPEPCAIPVQAGQAVIIDRDDTIVVAIGNGPGFVIEADLAQPVVADTLQDHNINAVTLYSDRPLVLLPKSASQNIDIDHRAQLTPAEYDALLESGLNFTVLNLLQGRFAPQGSWSEQLSKWRIVALAVVVLVMSYAALLFSEGQQLMQQAADIDVQTESVFRDALPDVRRMVNPVTQMQARLRENGEASGADFMVLTSVLFQALAVTDGAQLESLQFAKDRQILTASLSLPQYSDIEGLRSFVQAKGYTLTEGGARTTDSGVVSEITIGWVQ